ncbi:hypothetical protein W911_14465 [Hyphomicrobium nitrativorans NL23]|uniref:TonB-denpendent receptor n=1 Tax=Hyphomicrobium nitrativorans NL23 TaxID=1029756 RepID=V5SIM8_9HYPH|nr:TonB-dependent receptor [Hyphomicrobium nitrativorans]AHB50337.1 hypothetical protein W911_14465 [Hyphomicrobium nitrativorans NL23]
MLSVMAGAVAVMTSPALAQEAAQPAEGALPEVEVIQKKSPAPAAKKKAAAPKQASPAPQPPPAYDYVDAEPAAALENSPYGATNSSGAAERAAIGPISPINARTMLPDDLQDFSGAATRVTRDDIDQQHPLTNHEALARVPGVITVTDDGAGRHGGFGIRGSTYRRSRKVLVMEDGQPINFSTYIDSSTHYTPPIERVESIEVMRGPIVNYGPLNNHGVINFRNLSPFGANETVVKAGIGYTEGVDKDVNNFRHVHTRQNLGNVGVVASYSGADTGGSWDNEVLRYNDFYGALGFRGSNQDLTISGGYFRQRDNYDEYNFNGSKAEFRANGRRKADNNPAFTEDTPGTGIVGMDDNVYEADHYRLQIAHNYYFDRDTTLSTRLYGADSHRVRSYFADDAANAVVPTEMETRDRHYQNVGFDTRVEFANRSLFNGMTYDLQAGVRYEEQWFTNMNREGGPGLGINRPGDLARKEQLDAQAFAAFVQAAVHITPTFTVTPGVRFESYDVSYSREFNSGAPVNNPATLTSDHHELLPMLAFSWEAAPRSTFYGGYHRGLTPHIVRDAGDAGVDGWPLDSEIGDNFELGFRTTAVRGVTLDLAYFHNRIDNYQFREAFRGPFGSAVYSSLEEVHINGFEIYGRIDSKPFTGGPWNVFGEAVYTYADAEIEKGVDDAGVSVAGNTAPEAMKHFANLTLGVQYRDLWDASVTYTFRDSFYMDEENTFANETDSEWLLSARANFHVTDAVTLWASGQNLTNEFYISEVSGGYKAGLGRTVMGGFTWKFD